MHRIPVPRFDRIDGRASGRNVRARRDVRVASDASKRNNAKGSLVKRETMRQETNDREDPRSVSVPRFQDRTNERSDLAVIPHASGLARRLTTRERRKTDASEADAHVPRSLSDLRSPVVREDACCACVSRCEGNGTKRIASHRERNAWVPRSIRLVSRPAIRSKCKGCFLRTRVERNRAIVY